MFDSIFSMVQWLKRFSETREVVSSILNSEVFFFSFFLAILLHVLMFNYFDIAK